VFSYASGLVVNRDMEVLLACPHLQPLFLFDGRRNDESDPSSIFGGEIVRDCTVL